MASFRRPISEWSIGNTSKAVPGTQARQGRIDLSSRLISSLTREAAILAEQRRWQTIPLIDKQCYVVLADLFSTLLFLLLSAAADPCCNRTVQPYHT
jgi:hypothetical protein